MLLKKMVLQSETDEEHSYFISRFFVREGFYEKTELNPSFEGLNEGLELTESEKAILSLLEEKPGINSNEIKDTLGISHATVERAVKKFVENKRIVRKGTKKTGGWEILV